MFVLVILKLSQIFVYVLHLTISGTKVGGRDPIGDQTVYDCKVYLANVSRNVFAQSTQSKERYISNI